jgi:hypothetical protein
VRLGSGREAPLDHAAGQLEQHGLEPAGVVRPVGHGGRPLRLLEIISPGGLEVLFRRLAEPGGEYDPDTVPALAASYGCDVDFDATMPIAERHKLIF